MLYQGQIEHAEAPRDNLRQACQEVAALFVKSGIILLRYDWGGDKGEENIATVSNNPEDMHCVVFYDDGRWEYRDEYSLCYKGGDLLCWGDTFTVCWLPKTAHDKMAWLAAHERGEVLTERPRADGYWKGMEEE